MVLTRSKRKEKAGQAHLDQLIKHVQPTKQPVVRQPKAIQKGFTLQFRRQLTKADVERIYFLRFGSHDDESVVQHSYS